MVKLDIQAAVASSVTEGMGKVGMADTPENRIKVLANMHKTLVGETPDTNSIRSILIAIEDQIMQLNNELLS